MKKYEFTVFGTATTVKVFKFKEFPQPGVTTPISNTNFDKLYYGGKAWNIAYNMIKLGVPVYPVLAYSDDRMQDEIHRVNAEYGTKYLDSRYPEFMHNASDYKQLLNHICQAKETHHY